ncbi:MULTISPECIES: diacylglycerol/lipid kinase family protein [unclassified Streptomyces]|uniref:diacylglycerol/lipid kinase family protein n=1 Tax=unclassified Streptomyces TaxID=2593676 RepID=UPI003D761A29
MKRTPASGTRSGRRGEAARDVDVRPARRRARLALLLLAGTAALVASGTGSAGGWLVLLGGLAGLALAGAGLWWALAHRGPARLLGVVIAVAGPVGVIILYTAAGLWAIAVGALALWVGALASARSALRRLRRPRGMRGRRTPPPRRPVLIMNPRSGGGKVERHDLVARAEALGARVVLLAPDGGSDPEAEAARAVAEGADLLGVAGGDGTQALVAGVAAAHDVPFMVLAAGTRNHFAMDLGLDRTDPAHGLDALTDGVELRVDLGDVDGRPFVNTVSFGAYAEIVQHPEYRDAKAVTTLDHLPDLLLGEAGATLDVHADGTRLHAPQAVLVSNNPYGRADPLGGGRRPRLDSGLLGVIGIRVESAAQAAELALRGERAGAIRALPALRVEVTADEAPLPVAIDGEALTLPTPVVCTVRPRALRVRVPRHRPGATYAPPGVDWRRIVDLALGRPLNRHPQDGRGYSTMDAPAAGRREAEGA